MRFNPIALLSLSIFVPEGLSTPAPHHKHVVQNLGSIRSTISSTSSQTSSSSTRARSNSSSVRPSTSTSAAKITTTSLLKSQTSTLKSRSSSSKTAVSTRKSTTLKSISSSSWSKTSIVSTKQESTTSHWTVSTTLIASPTPSVKSTGKRGILYNSPATNIQHFNAPGSKVTWAYNWDSLMDVDFPSYMEFVPMLWGSGSGHTTNWKKNAQNAISRGSKALLAFNEPDACGGGQSCMTPEAAASAYLTYIQPFAGQVKLGGPAVTEVGTAWLLQFLSLCTNCTIDFIPMHIYNSATNVAYYKAHMTDIANKTGRPIWLTEFSASGNQTMFLQTLMPWMDAQPFIQRYSWFMCSPTYSGSTCGADSYPNTLGQVYELY